MPTSLRPDLLARDLAARDLSDPAQGVHAIQLLVADAADALVRAWRCDVRDGRGPRVVSITDNYDALGFSDDAVTRDVRFTRYVDEQHMLRSHASAMIPPALRALAACPSPDALLVCSGICYRRDSIDRLHTGMPHQMDLWRIGTRPLGDDDMDEMVDLLVDALTPGSEHRCETRVHPYTRHGRQVDVRWHGEWVEIAECGLASPEVLSAAGLDGFNGLAIGMGLDRLLMLRKGIPDMRLLRSDDPRIAEQMLDLDPYRPVSAMPAVRRDLSVAVDIDDLDEDLGDRVRNALGPEADVVEEVHVLSQTSYDELSEAARARIGMHASQKNVLVRITLRSLERTLDANEANQLRNRIYAAIHQGAEAQWAA